MMNDGSASHLSEQLFETLTFLDTFSSSHLGEQLFEILTGQERPSHLGEQLFETLTEKRGIVGQSASYVSP